MCTVTIFYKGNNDFILTSNRDEVPNRKALNPDTYLIKDTKVLMPKDKLSGGSWIGVNEKNRAVCLLNGGFDIHERKAHYRISRGVVVNDFLSMSNINFVHEYNFLDIEPFTIVIADWNTSLNFYQVVWDGEQAHFSQLGLDLYIWSSSTLYSEAQKKERLKWFNAFKPIRQKNSEIILNFHKTAGEGNLDYGTVMDRGIVKTTSITQIEKTGDEIKMIFENLNTSEITIKTFKLSALINE